MKGRSLLAASATALLVLACGACSTPLYTRDQAVTDLQRQANLTHTQATCVVSGIRTYYEGLIEAKQKAHNLSALPADRLKLEVDNALAAINEPTAAERAAARQVIARCAPAALG